MRRRDAARRSTNQPAVSAGELVIYSGIDWSGSPGDPFRDGQSPYLVIGMAQADGDALTALTATLGAIRRSQRLDEAFAIRYSHCSDKVRRAFFSRIATSGTFVFLSTVDKRAWHRPRRKGRPSEWLDEAIADLVCRVPEQTVAGQVLIIDRPKWETKAVLRTASTIKQALRGAGTHPFPKIKACPDDHPQGEIVQVADMFAGALAAASAGEPYLHLVRHRYAVV